MFWVDWKQRTNPKAKRRAEAGRRRFTCPINRQRSSTFFMFPGEHNSLAATLNWILCLAAKGFRIDIQLFRSVSMIATYFSGEHLLRRMHRYRHAAKFGWLSIWNIDDAVEFIFFRFVLLQSKWMQQLIRLDELSSSIIFTLKHLRNFCSWVYHRKPFLWSAPVKRNFLHYDPTKYIQNKRW